ncbi:MAG: D-glycerate dehydrogenase, partial [Planctomycetota bacterium]
LGELCELRFHNGDMPPTREELLYGVRGCSGILSLLSDRIDAEVCEAAGTQLKVVSNYAVGYNNIDVAEMRRRGIEIGNTPDVLTDATADIAVALLLAAARHFPKSILDVKAGKWRTWEPLGWVGQDLVSDPPKTLGIIGMGRIGEAVARRMHFGWGMNIVYTARSPKPEVDSQLSAQQVELSTLLETSDFISVHVPLSDQTRHFIGSAEFAAMKPTAVFVNTARGEVVDQDALIHALRSNQIFAAGLDVCTPEPLPADNPIQTLDNCIILPHIGSATAATRNAMAERAARNILAGIQDQPLPFRIPT